MKILLITGGSGVGKSSIAACLGQDERYNLIKSYTTRPKRAVESDHFFVSDDEMKDLLINHKCVAATCINGYYYCSFEHQFDPEKINVYVVDLHGIRDTIEAFPSAGFMTVLITRKNVDIDQTRKNRSVDVPSRNQVDFSIENDSDSIQSAVVTIKFLTLEFDGKFFKSNRKPTLSIQEEIQKHEEAIKEHQSEIVRLQELLDVYS